VTGAGGFDDDSIHCCAGRTHRTRNESAPGHLVRRRWGITRAASVVIVLILHQWFLGNGPWAPVQPD
jgi:hypothetical protein